MARQRGAQPGNVSAMKYPWRVLWKRKALRPRDHWVLKFVEDYQEGLIADKGGRDQISNAEARIIEIAQTARVCWLLAMAGFAQEGIMRQEILRSGGLKDAGNGNATMGEPIRVSERPKDVHPAFKEAKQYMALEVKALDRLGLKRRAKELDVLDVIKAEMTG